MSRASGRSTRRVFAWAAEFIKTVSKPVGPSYQTSRSLSGAGIINFTYLAMLPRRYLVGLVVPVLLFSACQNRQAVSTIDMRRAPATAPVEAKPELVLPPGVYVSPVQHGNADSAFTQTGEFRRTFPANQIGANLAFTANLRMPRLEAVGLDNGNYELRMRFSNATQEPLYVSLVCTYEGEANAERVIRSVEFPVNAFRDIVMELEGKSERKLNIQANAVPAL